LVQAGGEWSASCLCHFNPSERNPGTHWIGDWVGPRAGGHDKEKISHHCPARNLTLVVHPTELLMES